MFNMPRIIDLGYSDSPEPLYEKLDHSLAEEGDGDTDPAPPRRRRDLKRISPWLLHGLLAIFWLIAFGKVIMLRAASHTTPNPDENSPLSHVLSYSLIRWHTGKGDQRSAYQGPPTDQIDAAWDHLANTGIVALTAAEATTLHEPTVIFNTSKETGESTYLVAIEAFHHLHCLDMLRREFYGVLDEWMALHRPGWDKTEHAEHCIEYLRQGLVCRPSLELMPWTTYKGSSRFRAKEDNLHLCADFEAVRDWAIERQAGDMKPV